MKSSLTQPLLALGATLLLASSAAAAPQVDKTAIKAGTVVADESATQSGAGVTPKCS